MVSVLVSFGEVFDKYSILCLKEEKITDIEKLRYVREEKNELRSKIEKYLQDDLISFHFSILKWINDYIWKNCELIRVNDYTEHGYNNIVRKIVDFNDARVRVKNKIDYILSSPIREQKSYPKKKCVLYSHLGLGDQFNMVGAVRFLALFFDEVRLIIKTDQEKIIPNLFSDDPSIKYILNDYKELLQSGNLIDKDKQIMRIEKTQHSCPFLELVNNGYIILANGEVKEDVAYSNEYMQTFYEKFYNDVANQIQQPLSWDLRYMFSYLPRNREVEEKEKEKYKLNGKDYIFLHDDPLKAIY